MQAHDVFWRLEALSDRQLLERIGSMLGSSRRLMVELIAHLGEVEERRLHLLAACSSMFAYCLKLGMTEDEAYRRIEVARLARRYPAIFPLLADGQLSISGGRAAEALPVQRKSPGAARRSRGKSPWCKHESSWRPVSPPRRPLQREKARRAARADAAVIGPLDADGHGALHEWKGARYGWNGAVPHVRRAELARGLLSLWTSRGGQE